VRAFAVPTLISDIVDVFIYRKRVSGAQYLLMRRHAGSRLAGTWHGVHGHIEAGETAADAAIRETREETGLVPRVWHQLESVNTFFMAARDEIHLCAGFAACVGEEAEPVLNHEHDDYVWLDLDSACERVHWPGEGRALRQIHELILPGNAHAKTLRIR
jgi:dATP pyrophosphohydrolase